MLTIKNLHVTVHDKQILNGISLDIKPGEIHAIMGPNGSGKSTLGHVLAGRDGYEVTEGSVIFEGKDIADMSVDERARAGIFLAFQYPVEIPGVTSMNFLKTSVNAVREARGEGALDSFEFLQTVKAALADLEMDEALLKRAVNSGFSGGEKKRFDILQMALLNPRFTILDETDSGLDIDALRIVSECVSKLHTEDKSLLVITHYQRLLNYIVPDHVHVLAKGKILASGDKTLALELEEKGYGMFGLDDEPDSNGAKAA